ncbi:hypothetical protein CMK12_07170 [Candidatus Poribacteria bacterium]|jgi:hypothetical protein|nr:hypothetical protein [Candidatus Poribacteria bacterium]MDP6748099.1 hypothetical protein [Candidatus Poribacteria bacterium]MDP6961652.1 hypothetical protein [Dehalococcoidia bacterium]
MAFNIKKRGKLTYYYHGEAPVLSALVTEEIGDGDLKIYFSGLTGGYSAKGVLNLEELVFMEPEEEIPLVFKSWELWLQQAEICDSLKQVDFIEVHAFGCQPKSPNPLVDPEGFRAEQERLRQAYAKAYSGFFKEYMPESGVPARFTVHVVDVPDQAASYEFYATALYQKSLQAEE